MMRRTGVEAKLGSVACRLSCMLGLLEGALGVLVLGFTGP